MTVSTLDVERFRKVQALARGGATNGERIAANASLERMAKAAGLTKLQASKVAAEKPRPVMPSQPPASSMADAFNAIFNTPEARADRARRDAERRERCKAILGRYGSEDAVLRHAS